MTQNQRINRAVKRALVKQAECKQVHSRTSDLVGNSAVIYAEHDNIALGTQSNERVGNRIKMDRFRLNMEVVKNGVASYTACRLIVVESKLAELLVPTDVLTSDSVDATYSLQQLSTGDLRVVYDKYFILDEYHPTQSFQLNLKLREYVQWRGNTSTPASNAGGGLFMFMISDAASNVPFFTVDRALCFHDGNI
jgi:hypothetical protein